MTILQGILQPKSPPLVLSILKICLEQLLMLQRQQLRRLARPLREQHQTPAHLSCQCYRAKWRSADRSGGRASQLAQLQTPHCHLYVRLEAALQRRQQAP